MGWKPGFKQLFRLCYPSVELPFIERKPVVTAFYDEKLGNETGLEIGDIISVINNLPVEEIVKDRLKYSPASNYSTKSRDIQKIFSKSSDKNIPDSLGGVRTNFELINIMVSGTENIVRSVQDWQPELEKSIQTAVQNIHFSLKSSNHWC